MKVGKIPRMVAKINIRQFCGGFALLGQPDQDLVKVELDGLGEGAVSCWTGVMVQINREDGGYSEKKEMGVLCRGCRFVEGFAGTCKVRGERGI